MLLTYPSTSFLCLNCGSCCRDVTGHRRRIVMTLSDVNAITRETGVRAEEFCKPTHAAPLPFKFIMKKNSGSCVFLGIDSKCKIYDSRPIICRCYPFLVEFDAERVSFIICSNDCPGLGRGEELQRGFFESLANEVIAASDFGSKSRRREDLLNKHAQSL